eukprot:COSAG04_NODE_239_length_19076_cov_18.359138_7_plen_218_part_00
MMIDNFVCRMFYRIEAAAKTGSRGLQNLRGYAGLRHARKDKDPELFRGNEACTAQILPWVPLDAYGTEEELEELKELAKEKKNTTMTMPIPVVKNYKHRRTSKNCVQMSFDEICTAARKSTPTFSELLMPSDLLKPYVDVDLPCTPAQREELRASILEQYMKALKPLCPEYRIAISERVRDEKLSLHFVLDGCVCQADQMLGCLASLKHLPGFDPQA